MGSAFRARAAPPTHSISVEDIVLPTVPWWGRLLCLLNQHRFETCYSDDNEPYQRSVRCNRDLYIAPYRGGGAVSGPGASFGP